MRIRTLVSATALLALSAGALAAPQESVTFTNVASASTGSGGGRPPTEGVQVRTNAFTGAYNVGKMRVTAGSLAQVNTGTFVNEARIYVTPPTGNYSFVVQPYTLSGSAVTRTIPGDEAAKTFNLPEVVPAAGTWTFRFYESWEDGTGPATNSTHTSITLELDDDTTTGAPGSPVALGTLTDGVMVTDSSVNLVAGQVAWYSFTLPGDINTSNTRYLDIDTETSALTTANDTSMLLFGARGGVCFAVTASTTENPGMNVWLTSNAVASCPLNTDTDDGTDLLSQLTYGVGTRPAPGNGLAYNSRDGSGLPAGLYYLAVAGATGAQTAFGENFVVNSTGTYTGPLTVRVKTGVATAPAVVQDFGTLTLGNNYNDTSASIGAAGEVKWWKFNLASALNSGNGFLDIDTEGSAVTDTYLALFNNGGALVLSDDNDGSGATGAAQMSFGAGTRAPSGDSVAYNGRDGALAAGDYYVGVCASPTVTAVPVWSVTTTAVATGAVQLHIRTGTNAPPAVAFDFGTLAFPSTQSQTAQTLAAGQVKWYKFNLGTAISAANYLDIDTESGVGGLDTIIALYNNLGVASVSDDNDGSEVTGAAQLTFGGGVRSRVDANGLFYNGRDGATLATGDYYVAVAGGALATFTSGPGWGALSTSTVAGNFNINIRTGNNTAPGTAGGPALTEDLGTLTLDTPTVRTSVALAAGQVRWYKFAIPADANAAAARFLDIDDEGSALSGTNDPAMTLYNAAGTLVLTDGDDGSNALDQMSFGFGGSRAAVGNGLAYNNRDGARLAADGPYYLAIYGNNASNVTAANWGVASVSTDTGTINLRLLFGTSSAPATVADLGTITGTSGSTSVTTTSATDVKWVKFTLSQSVTKNNGRYLDIDTEGTLPATSATFLCLYSDVSRQGMFMISDTTDGSASLSQFSFGSGTRNLVIDGNRYDGRDGDLPAGTYYLGTCIGGTRTASHGWAFSVTGATAGTVNINFRENVTSAPAPDVTAGSLILNDPTVTNTFVGVTAGQVKWIKFTLPANVGTTAATYLDIDTETSTMLDTTLVLFNNKGWAVANDLDDGSLLLSQLSFGYGVNRPAVLSSSVYDGRDGQLGAGDYYLAVCGGPTGNNFFQAGNTGGWGMQSSSTQTGNVTVNIKYGSNVTMPVADINAGTLPKDGLFTTVSAASITAGAQVKWIKFYVPIDVTSYNGGYLDIDTETTGAPFTATNISLFRESDGTLVASDLTDGSGSLSQLTFGYGTVTTRAAVGTGLAYNGRDGATLNRGYYLLAVSEAGTARTIANGWQNAITAGATNVGTINVRFRLGEVVLTPGTPPAVTANFGTIRGNMSFDTTLTAGSQIKWFTFKIPQRAAQRDGTYLDFDTEESFLQTGTTSQNDTECAIYSPGGELVVTDDDTGSGFLTLLSMGSNVPRRTIYKTYNLSTGTAPTGAFIRNGSAADGSPTVNLLAAGTYYLGVASFNCNYTSPSTTSGATAFSAVPTGTYVGAVRLNFRTNLAKCNAADIASLGGSLVPDGSVTVDDLTSFLSAFFSGNLYAADLVALGGGQPQDGQITVDDLTYFLSVFFSNVCD